MCAKFLANNGLQVKLVYGQFSLSLFPSKRKLVLAHRIGRALPLASFNSYAGGLKFPFLGLNVKSIRKLNEMSADQTDKTFLKRQSMLRRNKKYLTWLIQNQEMAIISGCSWTRRRNKKTADCQQ